MKCDVCGRKGRTNGEGLCPGCRRDMARLDQEERPLPREHRWEAVSSLRDEVLRACPGLAAGFGGGR